jgi:hypothetical protein
MSIASSYEEASSAYSHGTYRPEQQTKSISTYLNIVKSYPFGFKVTIWRYKQQVNYIKLTLISGRKFGIPETF